MIISKSSKIILKYKNDHSVTSTYWLNSDGSSKDGYLELMPG